MRVTSGAQFVADGGQISAGRRKVPLLLPHAGLDVVYHEAVFREQPITGDISELDVTPGCCRHSCKISLLTHSETW